MVQTIDILGFPHSYELSAPTDSPIALVFVHGWLLSRHYWQPVIEQLQTEYQCLSYDLRGFGASQLPRQPLLTGGNTDSRAVSASPVLVQPASTGSVLTGALPNPAGMGFTRSTSGADTQTDVVASIATVSAAPNYSPAAYAHDLLALLKALRIDRAWLIGHSLGGSVALWTADQSPSMVQGVVCVNSGGGIYLKEEFERFRAAGQQLVRFRPSWFAYLPFLSWVLTRLNVAQPIAYRWGRQRLLDLLSAQPEAALGALLDSTTEKEVHLLPQVVARLQQPVHFIAGAKDTVMEPKYVHHLASFHRSFNACGNNVTELADCGHLAMVEQPQALAREIRSIVQNR